jgi:hypothetical protein
MRDQACELLQKFDMDLLAHRIDRRTKLGIDGDICCIAPIPDRDVSVYM